MVLDAGRRHFHIKRWKSATGAVADTKNLGKRASIGRAAVLQPSSLLHYSVGLCISHC